MTCTKNDDSDESHTSSRERKNHFFQWDGQLIQKFIYFFHKFHLSGHLLFFCKGPICLPNGTLAGKEPLPYSGQGLDCIVELFTRDAGDQLLMDRTAHSGKGLIIGLRHG